MKKIFPPVLLALLFALPFLQLMPFQIRSAGKADEGRDVFLAGRDIFRSPPIPAEGASGVIFCWRENFWEDERKVSFRIEGIERQPVLFRRRPDPYTACAEIYRDLLTYKVKRKLGQDVVFEPMPDPIVFSIIPEDGKPVEVLSDGGGAPRVWLVSQRRFGDAPLAGMGKLLARASHYKPLTPLYGYLLFALWLPLLVWTAWRSVRLFR